MTIRMTNGRANVEVGTEQQAENLQRFGYYRVPEPRKEDETETEVEIPKPRRGRPPKKAS